MESSRAKHTKLHKRLAQFLNRPEYERAYMGRTITMDPQRWGGRNVRHAFTREERIAALDAFYRRYNNGEYYQRFQAELKTTLERGRFR